jgi:glucosamine--fructose-6-phosphate aminotransferase (isomerizing)
VNGTHYRAEIGEQPAALRRLADRAADFAAVARRIGERKPTTVRLVGHGSSDNAAALGVYAFGLLPHLTALRDSISLSVYYGATVDMSSSVVVALSQSGQTPDVVQYVERARAAGAYTVAVTNDSSSALAEVSDAVLPLEVGTEQAVAATKTYTTQLAALVLLAAACSGRLALADDVRRVADNLEEALPGIATAAADVAQSFAFVGRMFVIGRGIEFATAREIALKLTETCRVAAEPLTATDLAHGPIAALDPMFPVWVVASDDEALPHVVAAAARARGAGAALIASGSAAAAVENAAYRLPVPRATTPLLAPLLSVAPGQLFAGALAAAKGLDPDMPVGLTKVTLAG